MSYKELEKIRGIDQEYLRAYFGGIYGVEVNDEEIKRRCSPPRRAWPAHTMKAIDIDAVDQSGLLSCGNGEYCSLAMI